MGRCITIKYDNGKLICLNAFTTGLNLGENVKSLAYLYHEGLKLQYIIAGVNNGRLKWYEEVIQ